MSRQNANATEAAQVLAQMVADRAAFPEAAVRDLARLLGHGLAVHSVARERSTRLGLLVDLVSSVSGEFIDTATYEAAREQRSKAGEEWPAASTLSRAYGHWLAAVRAAMRFWFDGGQARVASSHRHACRHAGYRPREIAAALRRCRDELGAWPTEWEYEEWRRVCRELSRRAGLPEPRLPSMPVVRKACGSFEAGLALADASGG